MGERVEAVTSSGPSAVWGWLPPSACTPGEGPSSPGTSLPAYFSTPGASGGLGSSLPEHVLISPCRSPNPANIFANSSFIRLTSDKAFGASRPCLLQELCVCLIPKVKVKGRGPRKTSQSTLSQYHIWSLS